MRKNVASQTVAFQMNATADGTAVTTGTPTVYYTIDGGTQGTGVGISAHEGNGQWSYAPAQAETNGDHVAFTMALTNAITQTVNVWPVAFDPTDATRMGITALPSAAAGAAGGLPTDSTGKTSFNDIAATDVVSGGAINTTTGAVDSVTTVTTTTTNTDMRGTDSAATAAALATVDANVGAILSDTADMQPKLGTPAGTDISSDIAAVKAETASIQTDTNAIEVDTQDIQTQIGTAGAGLTDLGGMSIGMKAEAQQEATDALNAYDPPTNAEMETRTPTAAQLAYIVSNAADGLPVTFTGGTTTTAILGNVDGSAASSTNDVYNDRILIFNSGTLNQQATDITAYDGATKTATITAVTTAVTSSHTANMK